jgi:hypothetical protein
VTLAGPRPCLSRFSTQMDKNLGFEGQKRLNDHCQRHNRWLQRHPRLEMAPRWAGVMLGPTGFFFRFFSSLSFFLWSPVAPELETDPRLGLARTAGTMYTKFSKAL